MSIFSFLFSSNNLSTYQWLLSREEIEDIVSRGDISSLTGDEEHLVEEVLERGRGSDGRISLFQIDEILRKLEGQKKISMNDHQALIKIFKQYFEKNRK